MRSAHNLKLAIADFSFATSRLDTSSFSRTADTMYNTVVTRLLLCYAASPSLWTPRFLVCFGSILPPIWDLVAQRPFILRGERTLWKYNTKYIYQDVPLCVLYYIIDNNKSGTHVLLQEIKHKPSENTIWRYSTAISSNRIGNREVKGILLNEPPSTNLN